MRGAAEEAAAEEATLGEEAAEVEATLGEEAAEVEAAAAVMRAGIRAACWAESAQPASRPTAGHSAPPVTASGY
jgi:hypothetical protein